MHFEMEKEIKKQDGILKRLRAASARCLNNRENLHRLYNSNQAIFRAEYRKKQIKRKLRRGGF